MLDQQLEQPVTAVKLNRRAAIVVVIMIGEVGGHGSTLERLGERCFWYGRFL